MMEKRVFVSMVLAVVLWQAIVASTLQVADKTLRIDPGKEEMLYYGFSQGDQIVFNVKENNDLEISEVEITEWPSTSRFSASFIKKIKSKKLMVTRTGIYRFRLKNGAATSRLCKITIDRIPASEETQNFSSAVYWRTIQDTSYVSVKKEFLIKCDTVVHEIYSSTPQLPASNYLNNHKNFQVVDFTLPENTTSWSFFIGTGTEAKAVFDKAKNSMTLNAASVVSKIPEYGPLAVLALTGVSYFTNVQGEDNVKYWFFKNAKEADNFQKGRKCEAFKMGDVITEASQMRSPLKGRVYLGILNDNTFEPIRVTVKIAAVQENKRYETRIVKEPKIENINEPYLRN